MLQPIHETTKDRESGKFAVTRVNPTRIYGRASTSGITWYTWQGGKYYSQSGTEIEIEDVPADIIANIESNPVRVDGGGPAITKVCQLCKEVMNASQLEDHLLSHVNEPLKAPAAKPADKPKPAAA